MNNSAIITIAAAFILSACSTTPVTEQTATPVPQERIYAPALVATSVSSQKAHVSFFRDSGLFGSGCSHDIYVNNVKAFAIRQGEYIHLTLDPGPYFFRLETGGGLCPNVATSQNTVLKEGAREVYRVLLPSDGSLRLTRTE
jgi:hypothetical protein